MKTLKQFLALTEGFEDNTNTATKHLNKEVVSAALAHKDADHHTVKIAAENPNKK